MCQNCTREGFTPKLHCGSGGCEVIKRSFEFCLVGPSVLVRPF